MNYKVVLVEPKYSMNIGSVARILYCFDIKDLILVRPQCEVINSDSRKYSLFAKEEVLERAKLINNLEELKNPKASLFAFTRRLGKKHRANNLVIDELYNILKEKNTTNYLVFGGEASGLSNKDIELCDYIVNIDLVKQSLSLPTAVSLVLYDLCGSLKKDTKPKNIANIKAKTIFLEKLKVYLIKQGFIDSKDKRNMLTVFEKMINKLDERELKILFSLFKEIKL